MSGGTLAVESAEGSFPFKSEGGRSRKAGAARQKKGNFFYQRAVARIRMAGAGRPEGPRSIGTLAVESEEGMFSFKSAGGSPELEGRSRNAGRPYPGGRETVAERTEGESRRSRGPGPHVGRHFGDRVIRR